MYYTKITEAKSELRSLAAEALAVWTEAGLPITKCPPSLMPVCVPNLKAQTPPPASLASLIHRRA